MKTNNIMNSCIGRHFRYLQFLRKYGTSPDSCDEDEKTLLFEVIEGGEGRHTSQEILYLLSHGWDVNHLDDYGSTPLDQTIYMSNWKAYALLSNYNPSECTLQKALNTALQYWGVTWNKKEMNRIILRIISSLKGISCQQNGKALESAIEGQAYPYIIPLLKAGYSLPDNMKFHIPAYLDEKWEIDLFLQFYAEVSRWTQKFNFTESCPFFLQDRKMQSRPQYEYMLCPKFSRKGKKRIGKKKYSLKDIWRMATNSFIINML